MTAIAEMARGGVRLDEQTVERLAEAQASADRRSLLRMLVPLLIAGLAGLAVVRWAMPYFGL
jgi:hypothetical protein